MSDTSENPVKFSMEELANLSGLSRRTIRFYIQKGLLRGPEGEKRGAYYTTEHLESLLRIKRMTEQHIPLNDILKSEGADDREAVNPQVGSVTVCSHICLGSGLTLVVDHNASEITGNALKEFAGMLLETIENFKKGRGKE